MMKKVIGSLVVLALLSVLPASAQGVRFGLKAGMNNTSMKFDASVFNSENRFGWFVGPIVKVGLPVTGLSADIAALYDQRETKLNSESIKQKSILIPINARYSFGLSSMANLYVAAGPQFGFNVGSENFNWKESDSYSNTFQLKKSKFSVNLGAGVGIGEHFELGFTYNIPLGKTGDATWKNTVDAVTSKSTYNENGSANAWTLSACYFF
ncbi:MAG: PorT family protein [Prevotella sp.]|nr:PorT family protein [Prevotella sp.]